MLSRGGKWLIAALLVCTGLLAALIYLPVVIVTGEYPRRTPQSMTRETLAGVQRAINEWTVEHARYPPAGTIEELEGQIAPLVRRANATANRKVRFDADGRIIDGWGRTLRLRRVGNTNQYLLYSAGANAVDELGMGDDIVRWLILAESEPETRQRAEEAVRRAR
jgi:hypothetical protein